ncbi:MAG TPA: hypothetical protein VF669_05620 [Tepidisphaeraceae bacterium]
MRDDALKQLLQAADTTHAGGNDPRALALAVKRRRNQQREVRVIASAASVVVLLVSLALIISKPGNRVAVQAEPHPAPKGDDLASLRVDARVHELTAQRLAQARRAQQATARVKAQQDPVAQVKFERDRAAMTLVYEADRFSREPMLASRAAEQYRTVIKLFPASTWADVARQRLRDL